MRDVVVHEGKVGASAVQVLHSDDELVAVDKPSGLLVHRGWDNDDDVLMTRVRDFLGQEVWPVHRLDRGTSGAVLFARNHAALVALNRQFEAGTVGKCYWALVRGTPPAEGVVDHPVPKTEGGARVPAVTRFARLAQSPVERCSLMEARPETGRFHQIRRHFKHLSHPLIGDVNYGSGEINRHYRAQYGMARLALHARELTFDHPTTGQRLCIVAPLAVELRQLFARLGVMPEGS